MDDGFYTNSGLDGELYRIFDSGLDWLGWHSSSQVESVWVALDGWLVGLRWMVGWLVGWLFGWLEGWLVGWVVGWLVGWLVGLLAGWLVGVGRTRLVVCFDTIRQSAWRWVGGLFGWLVGWFRTRLGVFRHNLSARV